MCGLGNRTLPRKWLCLGMRLSYLFSYFKLQKNVFLCLKIGKGKTKSRLYLPNIFLKLLPKRHLYYVLFVQTSVQL